MTEIERINQAIDEFAAAIKKRMAEKYYEGYRGWDGDYSADDLCYEIGDDAAEMLGTANYHKEAVDIGARAMMLWHRQKAME